MASGEINMVPNDDECDEMAGLASLMQRKMEVKPQLLSPSAGKSECCIFRVPPNLVEINKKAYFPSVVSIGPYHYGEEHLQMLQERKWKFLSSLLVRCEPRGIHLQQLIDAVSTEEKRIRDCYSECLNKIGRSKLVMMMVLDGCFIIKLLVRNHTRPNFDEPIFKMKWILFAIVLDLYKLENQIPYFVLEKLFELITPSLAVTTSTTLAGLALKFFRMTTPRPSDVIDFHINRINSQTDPIKHLLDLYWRSFMPPDENYTRHRYYLPKPPMIQSAQMLRKAGIKFRKKTTTNSFLDITFNEGTLEIPSFIIDDNHNRSLLLNFVAFEQCYNYYPPHMTSYIAIMKCLINSTADSEYLQSKQIIENYAGTHGEDAHFFHQIGKNVSFNMYRSYLFTVFEGINKYSSNDWRVGWGGIKEKYFGAPWAWIAALGALLGLLLAATQTAFTVLGYLNPPKK